MIESASRKPAWLTTPALLAGCDHAWLVALRVLIGALVCISAGRTLYFGWVERFFIRPTFMFPYHGFEWLPRPGATTTTGMFVALVVAGLAIILGAGYRVAMAVTFVLFTYLELLDVTNYLNHYYLLSLLTLLMGFLPAHKDLSIDSVISSKVKTLHHVTWHHHLLKFQLCTVYFWAGMAKFGEDWLLHGQPMQIWLRSRLETPLIGPLLTLPHMPIMMSWAGFLFDSTIWMFMLWPRTRRVAFAVIVVFHLSTGLLFNIGMFPFIMMCAATCFFAPDWPRKLPIIGSWFAPAQLGMPDNEDHHAAQHIHRITWALIACYCAFQLVFPARHLLYPGDVLWNEEGMRWSWKVMVREKNGAITYRVKLPKRPHEMHVSPTRYLTDHQAREMSGQPDMILKLGQHIGKEYQRDGHKHVEVRVDAWASLNGRAPERQIDPDVDLMHIKDSPWRAAWWILPAPSSAPPHLHSH